MIIIDKAKKEDVFELKNLLSSTWTDTYKTILSKETINKVKNLWHDPKLLETQCEAKDILFFIGRCIFS